MIGADAWPCLSESARRKPFSVGGGQQQDPFMSKDTMGLGKKVLWAGKVLDDLESGDHVKAIRSKRELLRACSGKANVGMSKRTWGDHGFIEIDGGESSIWIPALEALHEVPRTATDL